MNQSIIEFYKNNNIDEDFDADFYAKKYPETQDFYQPYCFNYGITDRYRLFYHYCVFAPKNYKNEQEYNKSKFISNVSVRESNENRKLAVITSFFNPCEYVNIKYNYLTFSNHIRQYAELFPIELSFNNSFFIRDKNVVQICGNVNNICWQKESLLNIVLDKLPSYFTDVAWIDCDIIMNNNFWLEELYSKLDSYKIVQLYNEGNRLDKNGNAYKFLSIVESYPHGESGFAWAARRECLDQIKLLDNQILGGADYIMASAFMNKPEMLSKLNNYIDDNNTKQWIKLASEVVGGSVGFLNNSITHLYHGDLNHRNYTNRYDLLSDFEKSTAHKDENNLWNISDSSRILSYFYNRKEDDNINSNSHLDYFINNSFLSHEHLIDFYICFICENLLKTNPETIEKITFKLKNSIDKYSKENCQIYEKNIKFYTRNELNDKDLWICKLIPKERITKQNTSGSTTGEPFHYFNDNKYFETIQRISEFDLILKEYDLYNKSLKILNLFKHPYNPKPEKFFLETHNHSGHKFHSYGAKESNTFFINWDDYIEKPEMWHDNFLNFLSNHYFDIVLCSGPVINILTRYIKKKNFSHKFAYLLSHTTEFPRITDFEFLKNNGNINYYCDHMRCWDGGASFFTCKHGTYHLSDNLSWVVQGPDNKMISTDYFNIVAPFVNYWNGDLCEIGNEYQLCECGRYYRPFKMLENRPFALKGPTKLNEIKQKIKNLSFKNKIDQVQFENLIANIYANSDLSEDEKQILDDVLRDYKTNYY